MKHFLLTMTVVTFLSSTTLLSQATFAEGKKDIRELRVHHLFTGKKQDLQTAFKRYDGAEMNDKWEVVDGAMHLKGKGGGTIITYNQYGDFELTLEWKISKNGNSGIIFRTQQGDKRSYFTGPEIQVIDNTYVGKGNVKLKKAQKAGSLYDLVAADPTAAKPVGQWNKAKIRLKNNQLTHWLNGKKVIDIKMHSDKWNKLVANSKFSKWKKFGKMKKGHIAFQDHGDEVWFRNITVEVLD